jgi:hypothetical protein
MGARDPFIPGRRSAGLLKAIGKWAPKVRVMSLDAGHVKTMVLSARHQYGLAGVERPRAWFRRLSAQLSFAQLALPWSATER